MTITSSWPGLTRLRILAAFAVGRGAGFVRQHPSPRREGAERAAHDQRIGQIGHEERERLHLVFGDQPRRFRRIPVEKEKHAAHEDVDTGRHAERVEPARDQRQPGIEKYRREHEDRDEHGTGGDGIFGREPHRQTPDEARIAAISLTLAQSGQPRCDGDHITTFWPQAAARACGLVFCRGAPSPNLARGILGRAAKRRHDAVPTNSIRFSLCTPTAKIGYWGHPWR